MAEMLTIPQTVARAKKDGLPISAYTLRQKVKSGAIPSILAGRAKYLLYYPNVVRYLKCETGGDIPPATRQGGNQP